MPRDRGLKLPSEPRHVQEGNKRTWNDERSREADFFSVGYMGRTIEDLVGILQSAGVCTVVDIRYAPVSMYRPEFSKSNLQQHLEVAGIDYLHLRELGVPRDVRGFAIDSGARDVIWEWYDENVVMPYVGTNLTHFLNLADHPVALLCVELDPTSCHRHRLVLALEERGLRSFDL